MVRADQGRATGSGAGLPAQGRELRARGRRTVRSLLDAGAAVFAERGYHAARVDDVVKRARTSHGTFYLYFANKEDLFRALAVDVAAGMVELARAFPAITRDAAGRRALRDWVADFGGLYERGAPVIQAWTEAEIVDDDLGRLGGDLVGEFTAVLAGRLRDAALDVDPDVAALAIVAMMERANYWLRTRQLDVDRDELVATLAAVAQAAVFGGAEPAPRPPPAAG